MILSYIIIGDSLKVEKMFNNNFFIYIYSFKDCEFDKIKKFLLCFKNYLKLQGFYKVLVCQKEIGIFLQVIKIEDSYYNNVLNFRMVSYDMNIYFETDDFFVLKDFNIVRYYDGMYYGLVDDSFGEIFEKIEFGNFVLDSNISSILEKSIMI